MPESPKAIGSMPALPTTAGPDYKTQWSPVDPKAPGFGKPILEYDPHGTGAVAYRALAKEFLERHAATTIQGTTASQPSR